MTDFSKTLMSLFAEVASEIDSIDSYIHSHLNHEWTAEQRSYDPDDPVKYLEGWAWTRSWDAFFRQTMELWDEEKISIPSLGILIETLSDPAARLDVLVPRLETECRRCLNVPQSVIRNPRELRTRVNSFLYGAEIGLNHRKGFTSEWPRSQASCETLGQLC